MGNSSNEAVSRKQEKPNWFLSVAHLIFCGQCLLLWADTTEHGNRQSLVAHFSSIPLEAAALSGLFVGPVLCIAFWTRAKRLQPTSEAEKMHLKNILVINLYYYYFQKNVHLLFRHRCLGQVWALFVCLWHIGRLSLSDTAVFLHRWYRDRGRLKKAVFILTKQFSHLASDSSPPDFKPKGWHWNNIHFSCDLSKRKRNKSRSPKNPTSLSAGGTPGNVGRIGLWGWRNAGLPISFPKHSRLQQTKYFHMLLLEHPGSWSNRGTASRAHSVLLGWWSSLQPGLQPAAWHRVSRCSFLSFIQLLSGFHLLSFSFFVFHHFSLFSPYVSWQQLFSTHSPVGFVVFMPLRNSMRDLRKTQDLFVRLLHPKQVGRWPQLLQWEVGY